VIRGAVLALLVAAGIGSGATFAGSAKGPRAMDAGAATRGLVVYQRYCANCHGVDADGNGRTAKLYETKPANLRKSRVNDEYKDLIIRRGGAKVGRSPYMPPWEEELTIVQRHDVIAYLRSIAR
jgi:mono/diheme cytochrome c family protein